MPATRVLVIMHRHWRLNAMVALLPDEVKSSLGCTFIYHANSVHRSHCNRSKLKSSATPVVDFFIGARGNLRDAVEVYRNIRKKMKDVETSTVRDVSISIQTMKFGVII